MTSIVLRVHDLEVRYGKREVLKGVNLQVHAGEWFCLLGPNGVGKSTLLQCIVGRLQTAAGEIVLSKHRMAPQAISAKRMVGYACAPESLPDLLTGWQCLELYAHAKSLEQIDPGVLDLACQLGVTRYLDEFVDTLSLGTRQKLCILLALLGEPALIVLDEAFNGLDPASAMVVKRYLQQQLEIGRCGVMLATHALDIVEHYASRAVLLLDGRVAREWNGAQLAKLREQGPRAFEEDLAAAARGCCDGVAAADTTG